MHFDKRYFGVGPGFRDESVGIARGINPWLCSQCKNKKQTYWIDIQTGKYICSEECLEKARKK